MFGALSAGIGATAGLINNLFQAKNAKAQRDFEREENQKTRDYNLELAKLQNTWNIEQWNRENDYNTPVQQRLRYAAAGLNPDLIYGQQNLSASSPQLTSGAPGTPTPSDSFNNLPTWGNVGTAALQGLETAARIKNINADTENKEADTDKKGEETKGLSIDNVYKALLHETTLKVGDSTFKLNVANTKCSEQEALNLVKELEKMEAERKNIEQSTVLLREQVSKIEHDKMMDLMNFMLRSKEVEAQIANLESVTSLNKQQLRYLILTESERVLGVQLDNKLKQQQFEHLDAKEKREAEDWRYSHGMLQSDYETVLSANNVKKLMNDTYMTNHWMMAIREVMGWFSGVFGGSASINHNVDSRPSVQKVGGYGAYK